MQKEAFEKILNVVSDQLRQETSTIKFSSSQQFEDRVRQVLDVHLSPLGYPIDFDPHPQAFPDIAIGKYGVEVKFSEKDTWRSIANSVLETNRVREVDHIYVVFCKMGGSPDVKWDLYEKCVMHVRTSHVPRFELEIGSTNSLFSQMGVDYDTFRSAEMHVKMQHIRGYARKRLAKGERLWWLEDSGGDQHTLPLEVRLYTSLDQKEKLRLRAEAVLLCPKIIQSSRSRNKYDDFVLYLMTYHGVLCHQARDLFTAGSVANPKNDDAGGIYIERSLKLLEEEMIEAALQMDDALFIEYWGRSVEPSARIREWLIEADRYAKGWKPSRSLFQSDRQ